MDIETLEENALYYLQNEPGEWEDVVRVLSKNRNEATLKTLYILHNGEMTRVHSDHVWKITRERKVNMRYIGKGDLEDYPEYLI